MKIRRFYIAISFLIPFLCSSLSFAQVRDNKNSGSTNSSGSFNTSGSLTDFNFELSGPQGESFYIDTYGLELLRQNPRGLSNIDVDSYRIGAGDLLTIQLKGNISSIMRGLSVNVNGDLVIPSVGTVEVDGKTLEEARKEIQQSVDDEFQSTSVKITLDQPRTVLAHINGQIPFPGSYQLPAFTRVDRAILPALIDNEENSNTNRTPLSGGVARNTNTRKTQLSLLKNENYSLRNIIIKHADASQDTADLISYFQTGDIDSNPYVRDGDIIKLHKLNTSSRRVSISGAIRNVELFQPVDDSLTDRSNQPLKKGNQGIPRQQLEVEFKEGDTIPSLIELAGGRREDASKEFVFVFRNGENGIEKQRITRENFADFEIQPFDRIIVPYSKDRKLAHNASVYGEVEYPGSYPIIEGKTSVFDILEMAEGLTDNALPQSAFLIRNHNDEQILTEEINEERLKRTSDQVLEGFRYLEMEGRLSEGRVFIDLQKPKQLKQVMLFDGDQLFVPRNDNTVFVFGQVKNPGYYSFHKNQQSSPKDFVEKAGGMTIAANLERIFVIKAGNKTWIPADKADLDPGDMLFVDRVPFENVAEKRQFELRKKQLKSDNVSLILSGIATIASVVTTIVAIQNN